MSKTSLGRLREDAGAFVWYYMRFVVSRGSFHHTFA